MASLGGAFSHNVMSGLYLTLICFYLISIFSLFLLYVSFVHICGFHFGVFLGLLSVQTSGCLRCVCFSCLFPFLGFLSPCSFCPTLCISFHLILLYFTITFCEASLLSLLVWFCCVFPRQGFSWLPWGLPFRPS